jgi:hypothetical protein
MDGDFPSTATINTFYYGSSGGASDSIALPEADGEVWIALNAGITDVLTITGNINGGNKTITGGQIIKLTRRYAACTIWLVSYLGPLDAINLDTLNQGKQNLKIVDSTGSLWAEYDAVNKHLSLGRATTSNTPTLEVYSTGLAAQFVRSSSSTSYTGTVAHKITNEDKTTGNFAAIGFATFDSVDVNRVAAAIHAVFTARTPGTLSADLVFDTSNATATPTEGFRLTSDKVTKFSTGIQYKHVNVATGYTALVDDYIITQTATGTITLPAPVAGLLGKTFLLNNMHSAAVDVVVVGGGTVIIPNASSSATATLSLGSGFNTYFTCVYNGSAYYWKGK